MSPLLVEIFSEFVELSLEIDGIPKEDLVEILSPNSSDKALDEGMGDGRVGECLDLVEA